MKTTTDNMSMGEAIDRLSDQNQPKRNDLASVNDSARASWDLNTSFGQAANLAAVGWQERADELWKFAQALAPCTDTGIVDRFDVSGGSVDVGRYLSGEPECMLDQVITPLSAIKIMVNISASSSVDARYLFNRGIALAAIIHSLQSSGRSISLTVGESVVSSNGTGDIHNTLIELQAFGEYINPGRLAFWIAHPAALRRCIFRYNEQQSDEIRSSIGFRDGNGYGRPRNLSPEPSTQTTILLPHLEYDNQSLYQSPEMALKHLVGEFKKQGVPIELPSE